ncbi:hypothetical protein OEZ85_008802 [Tetradesmus obliquus]|uniref:Plastid lipid-associated protein/fibrillin conserved domain-containing protein n=1 Tax=Tetradesmus obliquus TaxID=3088 RepID=A0ABY8TM30_TETOB|nr:hypothetical protein OEZ85_008802 [Tetradesmus obliquus]
MQARVLRSAVSRPLLQVRPVSAARRLIVRRSTGSAGAAGDLPGKDLLNAATQQAASVQKAASEAVAATAAATKQAALSLANEAAAGVDSLLADVSSSTADLKKQAGSSTKAAGAAMDKMVAAAIAKGQTLKETLAAGKPEVAAQIDAVLGRFVTRANELRSQLNSKQMDAGAVLDQTAAALAAFAAEVKEVIVAATAGSSGLSADEIKKQLPAAPAPSSGSAAAPGSIVGAVLPWLQLWSTLASLYYTDKLIKNVFVEFGIKFPSALAGMFGVFALLCVVGDGTASKIMGMYAPALNWIARWLPLFYVPALVTLPMALNGIPGSDLLRIVSILSVGMVATLLFTAQITVVIREAVKTPVKEIAKSKPAAPFLASHYIAWGSILIASLVATVVGGPELGFQAALPLGLAATVGGYLLGEAVPKAYHGVLHPVVVTALAANAGAALHGKLMGWSYIKAQQVYLAKGAGPMGAGDALMGLLGIVIISFGFRIYTQRDTMRRHFPEIFGATILSSVFSLFSTAFAAKALGLSAGLARALVPRSVTVALALPIAQGLEAPLAITAAAVLLQGILGANFGPGLMTKFGIKDTIARGLAAAGTAGGLGTASLTSKEPEALPFCALSYALVGIFSTVIMSVPAVRNIVIGIVG